MAGTIVVDRLESDASYASSINVASPMVVSNTLTMASSSRVSGDIIVGTTRSANTSARIEVSGGNSDAGLLIRTTSNTSYAGMRLYNATDTAVRALEIDYSSPGYSGSLVSAGPTGESGSITTTGAYPLTLGTNNTARITIDSSGRIRMPYQPAFYVQLTSGNISGAQTVLFNNILTNVGSHYNASTGRFTAPIAGLYEFHFTGLTNGGPNRMQAEIRINGSGFTILEQASGTGFQQGSMVLLYALNANDYVTVNINSSIDAMYGSGYNSFSGKLIG